MADSDAHSLTEGERAFLRALADLKVPFLLVGMSAALLQGARGATEDLDLWFENLEDPRVAEAARRAGGFIVLRAQPPMLGGMSERFDLVVSMSGLPDFGTEYSGAHDLDVDGVRVKVLGLDRILVSKRAANRAKDRAVIEALELAIEVLARTKAE